MSDFSQERLALERVRNIGILAHIDAGKTTLTERILYFTGVSPWLGEVDHGTAAMDWLPEEQERGITILAASTTCPWLDHQINLIDTPGHVDFTSEVERSLRVLDGVVVVVSGVDGVQPQTERVWHQADRHAVPRLVFVNKLDRLGADLEAALASLRDRLEVEPVSLVLPVWNEEGLEALIDLVGQRLLRFPPQQGMVSEPVPESLRDELEVGRELLLDAVLHDDERAMECYFSTGELPEDEIWRLVRAATIAGRIVPVFCGAAKPKLGIQPLLDGVVRVLPSPADRPPAEGVGKAGQGLSGSRLPTEDAPFSCLVFKFLSEGRGHRSYVRIYSGVARTGDPLLVPRLGREVILGDLGRVHINELMPVQAARAGDILAVDGLDDVVAGDTLCDPDAPIALEPISLPDPVMYVALEPRAEEDDQRLRQSMGWLRRRDPSLQVRVERETGRQLLCGMGELHLEVALEWLRREQRITVDAGTPQVAYRETPRGSAEGTGLVDRLVAGRGRFAEVRIVCAPGPVGEGVNIRAVERLGAPRPWVEATVEGIEDVLRIGARAGFPVTDLSVQIAELRHHDVDSTEQAFRLAGGLAIRQALAKAGCAVLEPMMRVEIVTPEEYMGAVLGDIHSRRGNVLDIVARGKQQSVQATAPLAELRGYATALRSLTQGRATHSMHLETYTPLPAKLVDQLPGRS